MLYTHTSSTFELQLYNISKKSLAVKTKFNSCHSVLYFFLVLENMVHETQATI